MFGRSWVQFLLGTQILSLSVDLRERMKEGMRENKLTQKKKIAVTFFFPRVNRT